MRPTTKRRLLILSIVALVIFGAGGGFALIRMNQIAARDQQSLADGLAAYKAGEYDRALQPLSAYLSKNKTDTDALFAMAVSRSMVTMPNGQHLREAIGLFNNYLDLKKGDLDGQHKLLELYSRVNWKPETLALADEILRSTPNDTQALKAKVSAFTAQQNFAAALKVSQKINELNPLDLESQRMTFLLMAQLKRPAAELLARAKAGLDSHPEDPRFELLQATAFAYAGQQDKAEEYLLQATKRKATDLEFVRLATKMLDSGGSYDLSQQLLERAVVDLKDPTVLKMLVERLWQNGQVEEMSKALESVKSDDTKADSNLLAMKAIALLEHNQSAQALVAVKLLATRSLDDEAFAWSAAIPARYGSPAPEPRIAVQTLTSAMNRDRDNAVLRLWLGEAYAKIGENELAIKSWRVAGDLAPAWAEPHVKQATTLALAGRGREAHEESLLAVKRAPKAIPSRVAGAMALSALTSDDPKAVPTPQLLKIVAQIQKDSPNESQTLPMYVTLLTQTDQRQQALKVIEQAIAAQPPVPADTLLRIAAVSNELKLDQQDVIYGAMIKAGDKSPELALARAKALLAIGKFEDGHKLLKDSANAGDRAAWQIAAAQYLDAAQKPEAETAWKNAVDAYPDDLRVHTAFLKSDSRSASRETWSKSIERVKSLTTEEGITWRLERSRYLLTGDSSDRDKADAVTMLNDLIRGNPDLVEPRLLLATTFLKTNNMSGAIDQLKNASQLRPNDPQIAMSLARLLISNGKSVEGQAYLERLGSSNLLTAAGVRTVAQMMADHGQYERAVQLLQSLKGSDSTRDAMVAQFYRRMNKPDDAGVMFDKVATATPITTDAIAAAADFYYSIGKAERANTVLSRMKEASDSPTVGTLEITRARLAEKYQSPQAAKELFLAATKVAPGARGWRELAAFSLRQRDFAGAKTAVSQAMNAAKGDDDLIALSKLTDEAAAIPGTVDVSAELYTLSTDPQNLAARALLTAAAQSAASKESPADRISRFRAISEKYPKYWPVERRLIQAHLEAKQFDKAKEAALRASNMFPNEAGPLQLLAAVYSAQGDYNALLIVSQQWRSRSIENPRPADIATAEAYLSLGRRREAISTLEPYLQSAKNNLAGSMDVIWLYSRAMLQEGRVSEVAAILEPEAKKNRETRRIWLALAGDVSPDIAASSAWIERMSPLLDLNSPEDQDALARAWYTVGVRYKNPGAYSKATPLIKALVERKDSDATLWAFYGEILRGANDLDGAEKAYRKALQLGDTAYSPNAVAFLLLTQERNLEEALSLADRAIASSPREAGYYDTRGQIYLQLKQYDPAIKDFEKALVLQPDMVDSMVGKAAALSQAGRKAKAAEMMRIIDAVMQRQPELSPFAKKQLSGLKSASAN